MHTRPVPSFCPSDLPMERDLNADQSRSSFAPSPGPRAAPARPLVAVPSTATGSVAGSTASTRSPSSSAPAPAPAPATAIAPAPPPAPPAAVAVVLAVALAAAAAARFAARLARRRPFLRPKEQAAVLNWRALSSISCGAHGTKGRVARQGGGRGLQARARALCIHVQMPSSWPPCGAAASCPGGSSLFERCSRASPVTPTAHCPVMDVWRGEGCVSEPGVGRGSAAGRALYLWFVSRRVHAVCYLSKHLGCVACGC